MDNTVALPKGRLYKNIFDKFKALGINLPDADCRTYMHTDYFPDADLFISKPKAIPQLLHCGFVKYGITGLDIVKNSEYADEIVPIHNFYFNKVKMCLCSRLSKEDLFSLNRPVIIATEFTGIASRYFTEKQRTHYIIDTTGSTEGYIDLCADCIIDVVETGDTLKANGLNIIDTLFESSTQLFTLKKYINESLPACLDKIVNKKPKHVYVEGNDGTGKTWLINKLQNDFDKEDVVFHDRCILTEMTLDERLSYILDKDLLGTDLLNDYADKLDKDGIYIFLNDSVDNCQKHILERGDSIDEKFHNKEDLEKFGKLYDNLWLILYRNSYHTIAGDKLPFYSDDLFVDWIKQRIVEYL